MRNTDEALDHLEIDDVVKNVHAVRRADLAAGVEIERLLFGNVSAELVPEAFETRATIVSTRVSATASLVYAPPRSIR